MGRVSLDDHHPQAVRGILRGWTINEEEDASGTYLRSAFSKFGEMSRGLSIIETVNDTSITPLSIPVSEPSFISSTGPSVTHLHLDNTEAITGEESIESDNDRSLGPKGLPKGWSYDTEADIRASGFLREELKKLRETRPNVSSIGSASTDTPLRVIGRDRRGSPWTTLGLLGRGAQGKVYALRYEDTNDAIFVAMKVISLHKISHSSIVGELRILECLEGADHPFLLGPMAIGGKWAWTSLGGFLHITMVCNVLFPPC